MSAERKDYFEGLYGAADDPYGLRNRWYERRKRAVLLASLPCERFASAYEPGCGAAELTAQLALRCDAVLASDFSTHAVAVARRRTEQLANVRVEKHDLPGDWPAAQAPFDLIVLSEVGYFLQADAWQQVAALCAETLAPNGTLVACDWRPDFSERVQPTARVHAALGAIGLHRLVLHAERDFLMQVWSRDPRSVAEREGIR
ncbi:class I SAM-dependent methyltransferase [Variovorax sp. J22R133]|uniref:class I SAM-dependent methyltransferase n=1 Tax=Variovorax brevis TaxID=3053503 RepID=UPI00257803A8|nr:class I SAM-dependent methyltransferase [Variovorax sp. J22R133]MDM0114042.1 class I SAM-dependent methyltransferase [Variovorax sp. J22R133]